MNSRYNENKELSKAVPYSIGISSREMINGLRGKPKDAVFRDDIFKDSPNRRQRKVKLAFGTEDKKSWAAKLYEALDEPYFYTLHPHTHLGFPDSYREPFMIFRDCAVEQLKQRLKELLLPPFYFKFEIGESGNLHVHVIANKNAGLMHIPRTGNVIKKVYDYPRLISYLSKPKIAYTAEHEQLLAKEKSRLRNQGQKCFPKISGTYGLTR